MMLFEEQCFPTPGYRFGNKIATPVRIELIDSNPIAFDHLPQFLRCRTKDGVDIQRLTHPLEHLRDRVFALYALP